MDNLKQFHVQQNLFKPELQVSTRILTKDPRATLTSPHPLMSGRHIRMSSRPAAVGMGIGMQLRFSYQITAPLAIVELSPECPRCQILFFEARLVVLLFSYLLQPRPPPLLLSFILLVVSSIREGWTSKCYSHSCRQENCNQKSSSSHYRCWYCFKKTLAGCECWRCRVLGCFYTDHPEPRLFLMNI